MAAVRRVGQSLGVTHHASVEDNLAGHRLVGAEGETLKGGIVIKEKGPGRALEGQNRVVVGRDAAPVRIEGARERRES